MTTDGEFWEGQLGPSPAKESGEALPLDSIQERMAKSLPDPAGFRILVYMLPVDKKTAGGVIRPDVLRDREQAASSIGFVVKLGPEAYKDPEGFKPRFVAGPYCKEGDFVVFRAYSGTRLSIHGHEFRLINDHSVEAVVEDPRGISRI